MSNAHSSFVGMIAISSLLYCLCFCVVTYASLMHPSLVHCLRVSIFHMPLAHSSSVGIVCASFTAAIALCLCRPVSVLNVYCALLYWRFELCISRYCIVSLLVMLDVDTQPSPFRASFQKPSHISRTFNSYLCRPFVTFLAAPLPSSSAVYFLLSAWITLLLEAIKDESSPHQAGNSRRTSASVEVDWLWCVDAGVFDAACRHSASLLCRSTFPAGAHSKYCMILLATPIDAAPFV